MKLSLSLRISGDQLDPDEITSILNVSPQFRRHKGEKHTSSSGKVVVSKSGMWTWKSDIDHGINECIDNLWNVFRHARPLLTSLPNAENAWVDICAVYCGSEASDHRIEFLLSPSSIAILQKIGLPVEFTTY